MEFDVILGIAISAMFFGVIIYFRAQTPAWQKVALKRTKQKAKLSNV